MPRNRTAGYFQSVSAVRPRRAWVALAALGGFAVLSVLSIVLALTWAPALAGPIEGAQVPAVDAAPVEGVPSGSAGAALAASASPLANNTVIQIQSDNPDPSVVGQGVSVAFRVDADPYAGVTPYGTVTVTNGVNTCARSSTLGNSPSYWTAWWWACTITPLTAGTQTITATFTPLSPTLYNSSVVTESHEVIPADTTTTLASAPPSPKACDTVTLTATVTANSPGSGTPTGTVTFYDGAVLLGTATLSGGKASLTTPPLSADQHFFTAIYNGSSNYNGSTSTAVAVKPTSVRPSVSLSVTPASPVTFGTSVTMSATINGTCGTATGHVYFNDNGRLVGTGAVSVTNGIATLVVPLMPGGTHQLKAVYETDNNTYTDSESPVQTYTVNLAPTQVTVTSSDSSSVWGQPVTFSATVAPNPSVPLTPTGQVNFYADGIYIGVGTLNGAGVAQFTTAALEVGSRSITASYSGDLNFAASTSPTFTQTVAEDPVGVKIVSGVNNPSRYGESVTFTAWVTPTAPGAGTPTGRVVFAVNGVDVATTQLLTGAGYSVATYISGQGDNTPLKNAGTTINVTARYVEADDPHFTCGGSNPSCTSPNYTQTVNPANTQVSLQAPLPPGIPIVYGQQLSFSAQVQAVQPGMGTVVGVIQFYSGTTSNPTPPAPPAGFIGAVGATTPTVTYQTTTLPVGTTYVCARYLHGNNPNSYNDNPNFNNSPVPQTPSACVQVDVQAAPSKTSLTSVPNPSDFGQTVIFTATVQSAGSSSSSITPTGTVSFTFPGGKVMTGALTLGVASVTTSTLPGGANPVTATYLGDGNFQPSSVTRTQNVNPLPTFMLLTATPSNSAANGQSVSFGVKITTTSGIVPTGTVTFYDFTTPVFTPTLNASGMATYTTSSLAGGSHSIKAVYLGNQNFGASSARIPYTITQVGSTTKLLSSLNPSTYGTSVTFTATVTRNDTSALVTTPDTVTFFDGGTVLCTSTLNGSGQATCTTAGLTVGTHVITAVFSGNSSIAGSVSNTVSQVVNKVTPSIAVTDSPDPTGYGQPVTLVATVSPVAGGAVPTGVVSFTVGAQYLGSAALNAGGVATLVTSAMAGGAGQTVTATYLGDTNYNPNSNTTVHSVTAAATTTTASTSPNPSVVGTSVLVQASVTSAAGTVNGGTVTFTANPGAIALGSATVSGGVASVNYTFTSVGSYNITAAYGGTSTFNASNNGGAYVHVVTDNPTDLSVTKVDSPDPVQAGSNVTYLVTVSNNGLATSVTLTDNLPPEATFVSLTPNSFSCTGVPAAGTYPTAPMVCTLATLAAPGSASLTVVLNVPDTTAAGVVLVNTVTVAGARPDSDTTNNTFVEKTTVYRSPRPADCNGDNAVDVSDVLSVIRRIFDPQPGTTSACDTNQDSKVDAGDVPCAALIVAGGPEACRPAGAQAAEVVPAAARPAVALPEEVAAEPNGDVALPIDFKANGQNITSLAFSIHYDASWLSFDPTDADGNGIPDALVLSLPGKFVAKVNFDASDRDGQIDVFVGDITPPLTTLSDGVIGSVMLKAGATPGAARGAVRFAADPGASFGDTAGRSVPGLATPSDTYKIYLPVLKRQ